MDINIKSETKPQSMEYDSMYPPLKSVGVASSIIVQEAPAPVIPTIVTKVSEEDNVTISSSERRFKECNSREIQTILKSVCHLYSVKVLPSYSQFGTLNIVVTGESKNLIDKAKFALKEQLSLQSSYCVNVNPKYLPRLAGKDKKNLSRFTKNFAAEFNINYEQGKITITGGSKSVIGVAKEILDYIAMNFDYYTKELIIPHIFHRFVQGIENKFIKDVIAASGNLLKISFPNPDDNSSKIILTGKKECVENASSKLTQYYEQLSKSCTTFEVVISKVQKEIISSNFNPEQVFIKQNVSMLFSIKDEEYETLTLVGSSLNSNIRGIQKQIYDLLKKNTVYSSKVPFWLCLFIERIPASISPLKEEFETLYYKFDTEKGFIYLIGEDSYMAKAQSVFANLVNALASKFTYAAIPILNEYIFALAGRDNSKLAAIEKETQTSIFIVKRPKALQLKDFAIKDDQSLIVIIGVHKNISKTQDYISKFIQSRSEFITVEIAAPNHLHKHIIGANGKTLRDLIGSFGPECNVTFGKTLEKLDTCTIKGSPNEVKALSAAIEAKLLQLREIHFVEEMDIPKNSLNIFTENNDSFKKEVERMGIEFKTIPSEAEGNCIKISLLGPKKNVLAAKELINQTLKEILKYKTIKMVVQDEFLLKLHEAGKDFIKAITDDAKGRVDVVLPSSTIKEKVISITGSPQNIEYVQNALKNVAKGDYGPYYFEILDIPVTFANEIIGAKGSNIFKIIGTSNVRVISQRRPDVKNVESILLVGSIDKVKYVKKLLEEEVKIKKDTIELKMEIPAHYKKDFLIRKEQQDLLLQQISKENGNVRIFIGDGEPRSKMAPVTITGPKMHVMAASEKIKAKVKLFDQRIEKPITYKFSHLENIYGRSKFLVRDIMDMYDVRLIIPQEFYDFIYNASKQVNINKPEIIEIKLFGLEASINKAVEYLNSYSYSANIFPLTNEFQKDVFAKDSRNYRIITKTHKVELEEDPTNSLQIVVRGMKKDVEAALKEMSQLSDTYFHHAMRINSKHFTRLIGKKGENVKAFNKQNGVIVSYPSSDSLNPDCVLIVGTKAACLAAENKLRSLISLWDQELTCELNFDIRVKPILFGVNGANIKKIQSDFNVTIKLISEDPHSAQPTSRKLQIHGLPEAVEKAKQHIEDILSSSLEDIEEESRYQLPKEAKYELDVSNIAKLEFINNATSSKKKSSNKISNTQNAVNGQVLKPVSYTNNASTNGNYVGKSMLDDNKVMYERSTGVEASESEGINVNRSNQDIHLNDEKSLENTVYGHTSHIESIRKSPIMDDIVNNIVSEDSLCHQMKVLDGTLDSYTKDITLTNIDQ